jgi:hypothetical protein
MLKEHNGTKLHIRRGAVTIIELLLSACCGLSLFHNLANGIDD